MPLPPVNAIPRARMSWPSSGGVSARADTTASTICATGSVMASRISSDVT